MKKIKYIALLLTLLTFGLTGCVRDDGNYKYKEIPDFSAKGVTVTVNGEAVTIVGSNKIVVNSRDHLSIVVEGEMGEGFDPAYSWMLFEVDPSIKPGSSPEDYYEPAEELATTKDFDQAFLKSPGKYTLFYVVMNKKNESRFYTEFTVEVESVKGLLIYEADQSGMADYSAVRTEEMGLELPPEKLGVIRNIYSNNNGGERVANPTHIWLRTVDDPGFEKQIFLGYVGGMVQVNYRSHIKEHDDYNAYFMFPIEEAPHNPQGHMNGSNKNEYLVQDGAVYSINYMQAARAVFNPLSAYSKYSPSMMTIPQYMENSYVNIVYNESYGCFENEGWGGLQPISYKAGSLGEDDVDVMNTNMELVFVDMGGGYSIDAVMLDSKGSYRYVRFSVGADEYGMGFEAECIQNIDLSTTAVDENSLWAVGSRGEAAFFSVGGELYLLNVSSGEVQSAGLALPSGAEIAVVEVLKDPNNPENAQNHNAVIFIGYNVGGEGTLLQYKFNATTGVIDTKSKQEFDGFGNILDVVLKR